jgi:drug/metabolite transporter (DMT)-like permease
MTMTEKKTDAKIELTLLLVLATLWGVSYTFIKIAVETIPPVTLIATRTLMAGAVLLAIIKARGLALPRDAATWWRFLFQACLNSVVPFTLIAWAERTIDAGPAAILNSTTPIFAFLLTALITRHEPLTGRKLFGVVAGIAGTCLIIGVEAFHGLGDELPAQLAVVAATVCATRERLSSVVDSRGLIRSCRLPDRSSAARSSSFPSALSLIGRGL